MLDGDAGVLMRVGILLVRYVRDRGESPGLCRELSFAQIRSDERFREKRRVPALLLAKTSANVQMCSARDAEASRRRPMPSSGHLH